MSLRRWPRLACWRSPATVCSSRRCATAPFQPAGDGTFTPQSIAIADGATLTLKVTDAHGRVTGPVTLATFSTYVPVINPRRITVGSDGNGVALVTGLAGAVSGDAP